MTGNDNIGLGTNSADAITTGACNIAMGKNALGASLTGTDNIAIGRDALLSSTDGIDNIAIGRCSMQASANDGDGNIAIGTTVMGTGDVSGGCNIRIGWVAMRYITTGDNNVAMGQGALGAATIAKCNVAIGLCAMKGVTTPQADENIAIGVQAMTGSVNTTGTRNVAIGRVAMDAITTGCRNVAIGQDALGALTTSDYSIGIGACAGIGVTTENAVINIGCAMNQTTAGVTCIGGSCVMATQFTATSDCRSKKNIKDLSYGLNFINLLRPVSYKWKPQADKLDKNGNLLEKGEGSHTHQRTMFGLLGQQVREVTKKLGLGYNDFAGFSDQEYENRNNPDWKKSYTMEDKTIQLTYDDFIAPLIKSVQELSAEVTELKAQLKTT